MSPIHSDSPSTPTSKGKSSIPNPNIFKPPVKIDPILSTFISPIPSSSSSSLFLSHSSRPHLGFHPPKRPSRRRLKIRLRAQIAARPVQAIHSVFLPPSTPLLQPLPAHPPRTLDHGPPSSHDQFENVVRLVKLAIENPSKPLLPKLNGSGSSGSYFCRAFVENAAEEETDKSDTVAIFKPKDEEPYGAMNPKWTKWAHRVFLAPIIGGFGRSCLIPNLSYLSEAAASLLDRRLSTYIVPRTEVVSLSSPTFFYSWLDLRRPCLPPKPGSFQLFCRGFENASTFLKAHPWPGKPVLDSSGIRRKRTRRCSLYRLLCGVRPNVEESGSDSSEDEEAGETKERGQGQEWHWTTELMDDFRGEMEKLVILDYLMRNTDRGLDNFMIKVCNLPSCHGRRSRKASTQSSSSAAPDDAPAGWAARAHCHVAAIDNSLAFPHHHPNGWRAYAYGWLFLPASLIGQPFSVATREHYLPLLTSARWWAETVHALRSLFGADPDFNVAMFERQMAVLKGQAWNVVESLKHADEGPLELCRRQKALVWDDPVEGAPVGQAGEPEARSAPPSQPYFAMPPMSVAGPDRPRIGRRYTTRTPGSSRVPRRPVGLASHHLSIDGARGLDVMNQMDALEAWQTDGDGQERLDTYGACEDGMQVSELAVAESQGELGDEGPDEGDDDEEEEEEEDGYSASRGETSRLLGPNLMKKSNAIAKKPLHQDQQEAGECNDVKKVGRTQGNGPSGMKGGGRGGVVGVVGMVERVEFVDVNPVFKNC